jgi:hypothetical protein
VDKLIFDFVNDSVYSNPSSTPKSAESSNTNSSVEASAEDDFEDEDFEPFSEVAPTKKGSIIKLEKPAFAVQHSLEISRQRPAATTMTPATTKVFFKRYWT